MIRYFDYIYVLKKNGNIKIKNCKTITYKPILPFFRVALTLR
jgi:hypothetical protein